MSSCSLYTPQPPYFFSLLRDTCIYTYFGTTGDTCPVTPKFFSMDFQYGILLDNYSAVIKIRKFTSTQCY